MSSPEDIAMKHVGISDINEATHGVPHTRTSSSLRVMKDDLSTLNQEETLR